MDEEIKPARHERAEHVKGDQQPSGPHSRRDFIQAVTAMTLTPFAANTLLAQEQKEGPAKVESEAGPIRMMEGTAGVLLVEQLRAAGTKYIFHTNTSGVEEIAIGLLNAPDMHIVMITHEGQSVAASEGYALATGELPFTILSSDGIENAASNLKNAWVDGTPMIVSFAGNELEAVEHFCNWSQGCTEASTIPSTLRRAMEYASGPPGGPVVLGLPSGLQETKIKTAIHTMTSPLKTRPVSRAPADVIDKLARSLIEAKNPLFIAGYEVTRANAVRALQALAEKLSVPVTQAARWEDLFFDFPTDHPLFLGNYINPMRYPQNVDLYVNFGAKFTGTGGRTGPPAGAKIAHVTYDAAQLGKVVKADMPMLADVAMTIKDLSDAIDSLATKDRLEKIRAARLQEVRAFGDMLRQSEATAAKARFDQNPISWERVGYELEQALDRHAVIVPELGTQNPKLLGQMTFGPDAKHKIGRTTGGALGWGMGAAFGVQLGLPDRQVVSLIGDGAFLFGQTETLWSIARYEAPLLIVVMNNHCYNETRNRNLGRGGADEDLTSYLGKPEVDFSKIASGYGIAGEKVKGPNDLAAAMKRGVSAVNSGEPYILDLEIRRDGILRESEWHSALSIAEMGGKKRRG